MGAIANAEVVVGAISSGAQVTIAIGVIGLIAGAFYAITQVTGARITDARAAMHREIDAFRSTVDARLEQLDTNADRRVSDQNERISDLGNRFEQQIAGASSELAAKLDALSDRADGIEKALGARLEQLEGEVQALRG